MTHEECIFCKVVSGDIPSNKVFEDDHFLAIMDIYPLAEGHCVVIPKEHHRWVNDVPNFEEYWKAAYKTAEILEKSLHPEWIQYFTYGEIPHAHIHVLPRFSKMTTVPKPAIIPKTDDAAKRKIKETFEKIQTFQKK